MAELNYSSRLFIEQEDIFIKNIPDICLQPFSLSYSDSGIVSVVTKVNVTAFVPEYQSMKAFRQAWIHVRDSTRINRFARPSKYTSSISNTLDNNYVGKRKSDNQLTTLLSRLEEIAIASAEWCSITCVLESILLVRFSNGALSFFKLDLNHCSNTENNRLVTEDGISISLQLNGFSRIPEFSTTFKSFCQSHSLSDNVSCTYFYPQSISLPLTPIAAAKSASQCILNWNLFIVCTGNYLSIWAIHGTTFAGFESVYFLARLINQFSK